MKKRNVLLLSVFAVATLFTSCSSDDSSSSSTSGDLEGKWEFSKQSITAFGQTSPEEDFEGNEPGCAKDYIEFQAGGQAEEGDYVTDCDLIKDNFTWSRSGKTLTINYGEGTGPETAEIVELTSNKLRVKRQETISGITGTINVTFIKAN